MLTSEEAYQSKLGEEVAKVARENEKAQRKKKLDARKEAAAKKKDSKEKSQNKKQKSLEVGATKNVKKHRMSVVRRTRKEANWQCDGCQGFYFDSGHSKFKEDWVTCVECHKVHFHNSCGVGRGHFDNDDLEGDFTCSSCFA